MEEYRQFAYEALRVAANSGLFVMINVTPGWYGGELSNIIADVDSIESIQNEIFVDEFGFRYEDFETNQEYGSLDKIIRTYGFIFGKNAIDYLRKTRKTSIKWKLRIHSLNVEKNLFNTKTVRNLSSAGSI